MKGVWPSWVMHSSLSPVHDPSPSTTANTAGFPFVHCRQSARISASLVGSKVTMMAWILRPLMPPWALAAFTNTLMAFFCSPNSMSPAKPKFEARLVRLEMGKTTLMVLLVTPLLDVLALLRAAIPAVRADDVAAEPGDDADVTATATAATVTAAAMRTRGGHAAPLRRRHDPVRPAGSDLTIAPTLLVAGPPRIRAPPVPRRSHTIGVSRPPHTPAVPAPPPCPRRPIEGGCGRSPGGAPWTRW